jgi:hypothetical protein
MLTEVASKTAAAKTARAINAVTAGGYLTLRSRAVPVPDDPCVTADTEPEGWVARTASVVGVAETPYVVDPNP